VVSLKQSFPYSFKIYFKDNLYTSSSQDPKHEVTIAKYRELIIELYHKDLLQTEIGVTGRYYKLPW